MRLSSFISNRFNNADFRFLFPVILSLFLVSFYITGCNGKRTEDGFAGSVERIPADEMAAMKDLPREGMVRSALTNEWIYEEVSWQRPIAVMFTADPKRHSLYGLDRVSIFYELAEEDGTGRQMGVLEDWHGLERIGGIGDIREDFIYAALEFDPVIVHSGKQDAYAEELLARADVDDLNSADISESADVGSDRILSAIGEAEFQQIHRNELYYGKEHFNFVSYSEPNTLEQYPAAIPASEVDMSGAFTETRPSFTCHPDDHLYYREICGEPQTDGESGAQLAFANILIQKADTVERDGNSSLLMQDTMKEGYYITRGKMIHVRWEKEGDYSPTRFYDDNGQEITVNTGKTMIFVIRDGADSFAVDGTLYN